MPVDPDSKALRMTAREMIKNPPPKLPLGEPVWELTNEVRHSSPIASAGGQVGRELVYHRRNGKQFRRRYVRPEDPETERQLSHQDRVRLTSREWKNVSAEDRLKWGEYAARYINPEQSGKYLGGVGQQLFNSAQQARLAWGADMAHTPPVLPPPPPIAHLVEVPAPEGEFAYQIEHTVVRPEGYLLELRMTPATPNKTRPLERNLVRAGATTAGSFFPLAESGAVYLLDHPLRQIASGERYGLQVHLFIPDGVKGPDRIYDLIRISPPEP